MLHDKVVLVTGAGSGIGRASALAFARQGATVAVLSRTGDEVSRVAEEIQGLGARGVPLVADVADEGLMRKAIATLADSFGRLDVVVANAGINGVWAPIDELQPAEWDRTIEVNLRGTYLTLHLTVPLLRKSAAGAIVIISSINGTRTFTTAGAVAYSATKAAQLAMAQQLALELGKDGITVNALCPGAIDTEIDQNTERRHTEDAAIPVIWPEGDIPVTHGKPGLPEDVADAVVFLASPAARHITGIPLWVDGGQSLLR
ncbi:SDR family NAD(P)-dependent oxidoreductase [Sinorhizobium sp. BG8]|uniref:SDR family oxidoreductase n=1 Tax=Sinorhizobium sp. BG8 TaxID=2613773 RepID=UPI00193D6BCE|nr:SDR family NAD(P)-dependent oxidoreductase [Sinorhizobium sp. BG8]QRM57384.1 SDR family oxidoreductase [Sinorhizobium sp. BG8]